MTPNLPNSINDTILWDPKENSIWIASSLILRRNLARYDFSSKLTEIDASQLIAQLEATLNDTFPKTHFFPNTEVSIDNRQLIYEHFLMMHGFKPPTNKASIGIDDKAQLLTLINLNNHLEFRSVTPGNDLNDTWLRLNEAEVNIGKTLDYAFNPKFGYLTSDPAECGTGLTASAYLHLPALVHTNKLEKALEKAEDPEIDFLGLSGDINELIGDIVVVENRYTIGLSEENILHAVQSASGKLLSAETVIRDHLRKDSDTHIKDQISKGFGLLTHSYQLEIKEALNLLSLMKLGNAIGLISGVNDETLSRLYFQSRKGHLMHRFPEVKNSEEIETKRADYIQKELKGIKVNG